MSGKKRSNIGEINIDELEISKISEVCIGLSVILKGLTV
jgi:hypothetical protein